MGEFFGDVFFPDIKKLVEAGLSYNSVKRLFKIPAVWGSKITGDQFAERLYPSCEPHSPWVVRSADSSSSLQATRHRTIMAAPNLVQAQGRTTSFRSKILSRSILSVVMVRFLSLDGGPCGPPVDELITRPCSGGE